MPLGEPMAICASRRNTEGRNICPFANKKAIFRACQFSFRSKGGSKVGHKVKKRREM